MVDRIAVCGDSFACGIGLDPQYCFEKSFGGSVAQHLNIPYDIYARSGCCNYVIMLQVEKVLTDHRHSTVKPLVIITTTHHSRFVIPSDHAKSGYNSYTLEDVDYTLHEPYSDRDAPRRPLPFTPSKKPKLVSETVSNFVYYDKGDAPNLKYLFSNIEHKYFAIKTYYEQLYDDEIKQTYDTGLILMMHNLLKEQKFPHIIMSPNKHNDRFIDKKNYLHNDWGMYSQQYPDTRGSGHCDEQGHRLVAYKLLEKINNEILVR